MLNHEVGTPPTHGRILGERWIFQIVAVVSAVLVLTATAVGQSGDARANAQVDNFVLANNGKYIDFDGAYGAQCADLIEKYNSEVVGAPRIGGNAKDMYGRAPDSHYLKLSANANPQKGDIAVWGASWGGGYGHVAIFLHNDANGMHMLTQNPGATHGQSFGRNGLIGFLRPKKFVAPTPPPKPVNQLPVSYLDEVSAKPGAVRVRGWSFDRDNLQASVVIHVYIGGAAGSSGAQGHDIGKANGDRPDVVKVHGSGVKVGFDKTITTSKRGTQEVCVYAINIGGSPNPLIGCRTVTIPDPPAPASTTPKPAAPKPSTPIPSTPMPSTPKPVDPINGGGGGGVAGSLGSLGGAN